MRFSDLVTIALAGAASAAPPGGRSDFKSDDIMVAGLQALNLQIAQHGYPNAPECTLKSVSVRREWSTLSSKEKNDYISAVQCLSKKPAKTPAGLAAGAKNRYDDFVANHINSTLSIHGTGNFLTWHRYFTWAYEQTLKKECGYQGTQPYYHWGYWAADPKKSPALDGSATSLGGDGAFVPGRANSCIPSPDQCGISLPPGEGGGCVTTGPFKDWKVNLGPVAPVLPNLPPNPEFFGLGYNPRCLRRDMSKTAASGWSKDQDIVDLIQNSPDFGSFSTTMQGDFGKGFLGVHTAGHFTVGGDPGGDLFASPGDPYFFLHHAMIDRTYWTWQNLDLNNRQYELAGTITVNNEPPSRNALLNDTLDLGYIGVPVITIKDASHTLGGPFCYIYA